MATTKIEFAHIAGIKADFVKQEVRITLSIGLTEGLMLRQQLADIAGAERPVSVEIKPKQSRLTLLPPDDTTTTLRHVDGNGEVHEVTVGQRAEEEQPETN